MVVFEQEKFIARLKSAIKKAGGPKRVSEISGVPLSSLNGYTGPRAALPTSDKLIAIAEACGVSIDWLAYSADINSGALYSIPWYNAEAFSGDGTLIENDNVEDYFAVRKDWLAKVAPINAKVGIMEAHGDSMEPTLQDGDVMMIDFNITRKNVSVGGVFVISVNGNLLVKRLQVMTSGDIKVISDNDIYVPELISARCLDDNVTVHAQVIWSGGKIRSR